MNLNSTFLVSGIGTEFWDDTRTLKELVSGEYFSNNEEQFDWPEVLAGMLDTSDPVRATVANGYQLAISALGACVWYLRQCCIDHEMLSLKSFEVSAVVASHIRTQGVVCRSTHLLTWLLWKLVLINGTLVSVWCWMVLLLPTLTLSIITANHKLAHF